MPGLTNMDSDQGYTEMKYGILLTGYGGYAVYHSGVSSGLLGYYSAGDIFRISIENGVVTFRRNGAIFYTSSVAPAYPLRADTTLATTGSTITNVIISGNLTP
jgi:trehalose utilization protein